VKAGSITIKGHKELIANLKKLDKNMGAAIKNGLRLSAEDARTKAIRSIQAQSVGKVVTRISQGGNQYEHTVSRPGDAPNTDSGNLVKNIAVEVKSPTSVEVGIGEAASYGAHLEFGTERMESRPWLLPAAESVDFIGIMGKAIQFQVEKAAIK
jgi:HK97 gp10 family phage protein